MDISAVSPSGMSATLQRIAAIQSAMGAVSAPGSTATAGARSATSAASGTGTFADALAGAQASFPTSGTTLAADPSAAGQQWVLPVNGGITSPFGMRRHPVTGVYKLHTGVDFAASTGTPIGAAAAGTVRSAGWLNGDGYSVVIDHGNGISTLYGHASKLLVTPGEHVAAGQVIAAAGATGLATGPHLHLEVRRDDQPMDPVPWLREHGLAV